MRTAGWILLAALAPTLVVWTAGAAGGEAGAGAASKGGPAGATTAKGSTASPKPDGAGTGPAGTREAAGKPDVAPELAGNGASADVHRMVQDFREQQKVRLDEYRRLAAQARDAGAEKREQLRAQLRQMLEEQKQERDRLREQIRERLHELTATLPSRQEVIEAAKEKARGRQDRGRGE